MTEEEVARFGQRREVTFPVFPDSTSERPARSLNPTRRYAGFGICNVPTHCIKIKIF